MIGYVIAIPYGNGKRDREYANTLYQPYYIHKGVKIPCVESKTLKGAKVFATLEEAEIALKSRRLIYENCNTDLFPVTIERVRTAKNGTVRHIKAA